MAESWRLNDYDDLSIVVRFAKLFGLDPDYVYDNKSFETVMNVLAMEKESDEYHERYMKFWHVVNKEPETK